MSNTEIIVSERIVPMYATQGSNIPSGYILIKTVRG